MDMTFLGHVRPDACWGQTAPALYVVPSSREEVGRGQLVVDGLALFFEC